MHRRGGGPERRGGVVGLVLAVGLLIAGPGSVPGEETASGLTDATCDLVTAASAYRASLERLLGLYEKERARAAADLEQRRHLLSRELVAPRDVQVGERTLAATEARMAEVQRQLAASNALIAEAIARERLARLPPLPAGGYQVANDLIRYRGPAPWSLADAGKLERFFQSAFGRPLPVSAAGQTLLHDRFALDHRNALDVAVHPDTAEGRALIAHLRQEGIPFLAFREAVAGASTGAHIHVGEPSERRPAPRR